MKQTILPERLLSCRNNLGLTQSEAAELIGITQPAYQRYEAGVRTPSIQVAKEIAKAFNVSTAYLFGDSDQSLPDYFVIDKNDNQLLFSLIEQCKGLSDDQLEEILNNITKSKNNLAETERFELSCQLPGKRISSAPRYDHFDTSPNAPYCNRLTLNIQLKALCNNVKVRQTLCFYAILPWHPHRRDNLREQGRNQLMFPLPGW